MISEERWVGVEYVAAHLDVNKDSIYRWIEKRGLPPHLMGRLREFAPYFGLSISRVDPLTHQLEAIYDYLLKSVDTMTQSMMVREKQPPYGKKDQ